MKLSAIQKKHFGAMTAAELNEVIADAGRQVGVIAMSTTKAADKKRAELQARIDYCTKLKYAKR